MWCREHHTLARCKHRYDTDWNSRFALRQRGDDMKPVALDSIIGDTGYLAEVGNRTEAFEDIVWNLINSTEFISRR